MSFKIHSANEVGIRHQREGHSSQDATHYMEQDGICCIALADGAGSRSLAGEGAACAVHAVCKLMCERFYEFYTCPDRSFVETAIVSHVRQALEQLAEGMGKPSFLFASTLLCAVTDGKQYLLCHIGDGAILAARGVDWNVMSFPKNGSTKTETVFTTTFGVEAKMNLERGQCGDIEQFCLASDGLLEVIFQDQFTMKTEQRLRAAMETGMQQPHEDDASYISCSWGGEADGYKQGKFEAE